MRALTIASTAHRRVRGESDQTSWQPPHQPHQPPHQAHQHTGTGAPGRGFGDGEGRKRARGYTLQRGRRGLAGVGVGVGRAVLKLPCTKFASLTGANGTGAARRTHAAASTIILFHSILDLALALYTLAGLSSGQARCGCTHRCSCCSCRRSVQRRTNELQAGRHRALTHRLPHRGSIST
jgi:hypothetical protein